MNDDIGAGLGEGAGGCAAHAARGAGYKSSLLAKTYAATFDTNVLDTVLSLKHELRIMQAQGSGSIVNILSTYGHEGAAGAAILRRQQACV